VVIRWGFGLAVVAVLLVYFDARSVVSLLGSVSWPLAVPAILGLAAMHLVGAATWKLLLARLSDVHLDWPYVTRAYYAAQAAGSLTPGNIGGDIYRVYATSGGTHRRGAAMAPVAAQRVTSLVGLVALGVVASLFVPLPAGAVEALAVVGGLAVAVSGSILVLNRRASTPHSLFARLVRRLSLSDWWSSPPGKLLWTALGSGLLLGLAFHAGSVALTYLLVVALGGEAAVVPTLAALVLARLSILVPVSFNGLGFQEGALALLFPAVGMTAEMGLAVSLLNRLALFITVVIGAVSLSTGKAPMRKSGKKSERKVTVPGPSTHR
jgi:hypothetical protein